MAIGRRTDHGHGYCHGHHALTPWHRHLFDPPRLDLIRKLEFRRRTLAPGICIGHAETRVMFTRYRFRVNQQRLRRERAGQSLLELIAATTIIAIALVPALKLMRDSIRIGRETETANVLATFGMSKLEEHLARTAASWDATTEAGDIPNYAGLRFQVTKVDEGFGSGLMRITSNAYEDLNGNATWDNNERRVVFVAKVAKNAAYQQEAS